MTSSHYQREKEDKCFRISLIGVVFILGSLLYVAILIISIQYDEFTSSDFYSFGELSTNLTHNLTYNTTSIKLDDLNDLDDSKNVFDHALTHPVSILYILCILSCGCCCICICLDL